MSDASGAGSNDDAVPPMPPPPGWQTAAQQPGVIPLRPLNIGDIFGGAIATIRRYPTLTIGFSAGVAAVVGLVSIAGLMLGMGELTDAMRIAPGASPEQLAEGLRALLTVTAFAAITGLLANVFLTGVLTTVMGRAVLGKQTTFAEVWASVKPILPRLLGVTFLIPLAVAAISLPVIGLLFVAPDAGLVLALVAAAVAIWLAVTFVFAAPALVLERTDVLAALKRSFALVKGSWWRIFGVVVLASILTSLLSSIIQIPFDLIGGGPSTPSGIIGSTVGTVVGSAITAPFVTGVIALLYIDQRIRRENLAPELLRSAELES